MMGINPEEVAKNVILRQYGSEENAIRALKQQAGSNPVLKNAVSLFEKKDYKGLQNLGQNVFKENHINPQSIAQNFMQIYIK